ncbi:hypothetical protein [Neobacillus sp. OS1-33]|jgi:uncharacterized protein (UPF0147 family)|uniref:hypothetical protein n=1 Tax=Neobacillus sp. OS1-33 TaxID=3070683 RepID=UPI0027E19B17|nr:hypothetical protein [Neobacillus sp. OS1-33]WML27329.1 hypothetical protein RCG22_06825 [Neobacillus sp. OS1-33]
MMALATIKVVATQLEMIKQIFQVIKDITLDERVPAAVREEIMDKVNTIIESDDEC